MAADRTGQQRAFQERGYALVEHVVPPPLLANLADYFQTRSQGDAFSAGDKDVPGARACYGDSRGEVLLMMLQPVVEEVVGLDLLPTYSYTRVYQPGDDLKPHTDRPACEISATLTISADPAHPWPIFVDDSGGDSRANVVVIDPGSLLVYRGMEVRHWREALEGRSQTQIFLHWVDANGPHASEVYDGRDGLNFQIGGD